MAQAYPLCDVKISFAPREILKVTIVPMVSWTVDLATYPLLPKAIKVALNACLLKSIRSAFDPGVTELKPLSFYSGVTGVSNRELGEAKKSSQGNQHHLEYTEEV